MKGVKMNIVGLKKFEGMTDYEVRRVKLTLLLRNWNKREENSNCIGKIKVKFANAEL